MRLLAETLLSSCSLPSKAVGPHSSCLPPWNSITEPPITSHNLEHALPLQPLSLASSSLLPSFSGQSVPSEHRAGLRASGEPRMINLLPSDIKVKPTEDAFFKLVNKPCCNVFPLLELRQPHETVV